ncbi:MMPL family transporter [Sulfurisphaera tokodaii]|nr:MMPL family transporter [Sulfurisphaera tokodaii]HII72815.1 MMPL family transporter [Sulfurisphaera tokodaii]
MKAYLILWLVLLVILAPFALNIQHLFVYSDSPFLNSQFASVKVKDILVKYFNFSTNDDIYVITKGNYSTSLKIVNDTASKYLQNYKLLTPYYILNESNSSYFSVIFPVVEKVYKEILPLHELYKNLTTLRLLLLNNITSFYFQLNVTYGLPLGKFKSNSSLALKFLAVYSALKNGTDVEKARNASYIVFKDPYVFLFSFNNYSNVNLVTNTLEDFKDYAYLIRIITGKNVSTAEIEDPLNYSLNLVEKEFPPPPLSINQFHKGDEWLFIVQVPSNESLIDVEMFMKALSNAIITGHLPIYAESAVVTEQDLRIIDIFTILILTILLIVLVRSLVPIIILIVSAVIGLVIAYSLLYLLTFFGYSIYYISGLVIPPIVFGITVDYSILFLYRYFEEVRKGEKEPLKVAFRTAGRAVLFSGLSITLGFSSFLFSSSPLLRNIGIALVISSISSLVPAILFIRTALASIQVRWLSFPRKEIPNPQDVRQRYLEKISKVSINHKYWVLLFMIVLAVASYSVFITHHTNVAIDEIVPSSSEVVRGEQLLGQLYNYSVDYVIIKGNPNTTYSEIYNLSKELINKGALVYGPASIGKALFVNKTYVTNLYYSHNYSLLEVYIPYPVFSHGAINLTKQLINEGYLVGGSNAERIDIVDNTVNLYYTEVLPLTIVIITVYLVISLGSVLVPIRLSLTLLLSSLFGVSILYLVYGSLYWLTPLIVFAIMYSLGIDYDMFIIIRILEEKGNDEERIVNAVKKTGLVVTAAGLILAGAFLSLMSSDMRFLQEIGFGVGITILFDTFVVRPIFVPAILAILKKYNWWPRMMSLTRDDR